MKHYLTLEVEYCGTFSRIRWVNRTFYANCALDVITDSLSKLMSNLLPGGMR
jgi:hypothetical protein